MLTFYPCYVAARMLKGRVFPMNTAVIFYSAIALFYPLILTVHFNLLVSNYLMEIFLLFFFILIFFLKLVINEKVVTNMEKKYENESILHRIAYTVCVIVLFGTGLILFVSM